MEVQQERNEHTHQLSGKAIPPKSTALTYFTLPKDCNIHYIQNADKCSLLCTKLVRKFEIGMERVVCGFDAEWPVTSDANDINVTVLQLCIDYDNVYVFQISKMSYFPCRLRTILENVIKVGVNVKHDVRLCVAQFKLDAVKSLATCIDLSTVTNQVFEKDRIWGLASLTRFLCNKDLNKEKKLRCGAWNEELDLDQLNYAAIDAYIAYHLYKILEIERRKPLSPHKFKHETFKPASRNSPSIPYFRMPEGTEIIYSHNYSDCCLICQDLIEKYKLNDTQVHIGFDAEWPTSFDSKRFNVISVIQMCFSLDYCYVFQVSQMTTFPPPLKYIIEHKNTVKVGVKVKGDIKKCIKDFGVDSEKSLTSFSDLSEMANQVFDRKQIWGMSSLCQFLFQKDVWKGEQIRCSDWDKYPLSDHQLKYAALDAYLSLRIHNELMNQWLLSEF